MVFAQSDSYYKFFDYKFLRVVTCVPPAEKKKKKNAMTKLTLKSDQIFTTFVLSLYSFMASGY